MRFHRRSPHSIFTRTALSIRETVWAKETVLDDLVGAGEQYLEKFKPSDLERIGARPYAKSGRTE
jgi:hypothetical protein